MKAEIVAEIGSNWEGSVSKAKKLIKECKMAGADAVKFQVWRAFDLYSKKNPSWNVIKKSEITFETAKTFKNFCDDLEIEFISSVFYPEAVDFLESLNVQRYKVASRTVLFKDPFSYETLLKEAKTKKSIIVSMGMGGNINKIKKIFSKNKTTFCYCISEYPLNFNKINWKKAMQYVGFSDHTLGITAPIIFATLHNYKSTKKILIEKHVKLTDSKGPDAPSSITTNELSNLINHIRKIENVKF